MRVYCDTSLFGGCFDEEFAAPSEMFFRQVREGRWNLVTSTLVEEEIAPAPDPVRELFDEMLAYAEVVEVTEEAVLLRRAYVDAGIVRPTALADALHVATASVNR